MAITNFIGSRPPVLHPLIYSQPTGVTDTLGEGQCVALSDSAIGVDLEFQATRPDMKNLARPMFIVSRSGSGGGENSQFSGIRLGSSPLPVINIHTDQAIVAGDILGPQPRTTTLRRGAIFSSFGFRALQTVDRSVTPGIVQCDYIPSLSRLDRMRAQFEWYDDFNAFTTGQEGWTAIAGGTPAGTVANTAIGGGRVVLTSGAAQDNASALIHGQSLGGPFFPSTAGQAAYFECVLVPTEHNTDDMNIFAGFVDAAQVISATLPILDDSSLVGADLMAFSKKENTSVWNGKTFGASTAGTASGGVQAAFVSGTPSLLQILHDGKTGVHFWVNSVYAGTVSTATAMPVAAMIPVFQVKAGSLTGTPNIAVHHFFGTHVKSNLQVA